MKILVIVHWFPPAKTGGTEVYADNLARGLQARGNDVHVYTTAKRPDRPQYEVSHTEIDGLPVTEVVHNWKYQSFRNFYKDETMEGHLRDVLDKVQPDVACIQHLNFHGLGYPAILDERGIPMIYTLAEFLNICLREGWLLTPDLKLCDGPSPEKCTVCAVRMPLPDPADATSDRVGKIVPRRPFSIPRMLRKLRNRITGSDRPVDGFPLEWSGGDINPWTDAVELKMRETREALDHVDLFVAPSAFLKEQFVKAGMIDDERILVSDYGMDPTPFKGVSRKEDDGPRPLRVGFLGWVSEQKGVDVLIRACDDLPGSKAECHIWGASDPEHLQGLQRISKNPAIRFFGAYKNEQVAEILTTLDILVVPSIWYENSPLVIHEAYLAGVPVITGSRGGMAGLVEDGVNGLLFEIGNSDELRRQIQRIIDEPELLERFRGAIPHVKTVEEDARDMEEKMKELIRKRSGGKDPAVRAS